MADEVEEKEDKPISIAEALKEGVKSASSWAAATISTWMNADAKPM